MSVKDFQDKSLSAPVPRELAALQQATGELVAATRSRQKDKASVLLDELSRLWRQGNTLQLTLSARSEGGGADGVLVQLAEALNAASDAKAHAQLLVNGLGETYRS